MMSVVLRNFGGWVAEARICSSRTLCRPSPKQTWVFQIIALMILIGVMGARCGGRYKRLQVSSHFAREEAQAASR